MSDRPDFTLPISIEAYTIGSLPIDIIAQTIGNVNINIAAQAGNLEIDINAQSVSIKDFPSWSAVEGEDVDMEGNQVPAITATFYTLISYTVPAGKTLYVYDYSAVILNGNEQVYVALYNNTIGQFVSRSGGTRGQNIQLAKPKVFTENQVLHLRARHDAGANRDLGGTLGGILV